MVLTLLARTAAADEQRVRVLVWSGAGAAQASAGDAPFLSRLRGQTVDLPVELFEVSGSDGSKVEQSAAARLEAQVARASELAHRHRARVVVWRSSEELFLYVAEPTPAHLLVRRLAWGANTEAAGEGRHRNAADPGSAVLESAALIVRAALRSVIEGGTVGVPRAIPQPVAPPLASPPPQQSLPSAIPSPFYFLLLIDLRLGSDAIGNSAPRGVGTHLGAGWRRFSGGFTGMASFDRDVGTTAVSQPFWRQNAALFLAMDLVQARRARLTGEVLGGVAYFNLYRSAGTLRRPYLLTGFELRGMVDALVHGRLRVPVWLGIGADYIPDAPPLTLGPTTRVLWVTRKFQPRVMLGIGLSF